MIGSEAENCHHCLIQVNCAHSKNHVKLVLLFVAGVCKEYILNHTLRPSFWSNFPVVHELQIVSLQLLQADEGLGIGVPLCSILVQAALQSLPSMRLRQMLVSLSPCEWNPKKFTELPDMFVGAFRLLMWNQHFNRLSTFLSTTLLRWLAQTSPTRENHSPSSRCSRRSISV